MPLKTYEALIERLSETLAKEEPVQSIYQVGSVRHPGISDLDLVCIFNSDSAVDINVREQLTEDELYILTHNLFGIQQNNLENSFRYSFYTGYRLVNGQEQNIPNDPTQLISEELKRQIALEFMLKMYISMYTQITYRTIKLRAFLLEAKAIAFDLELLGITLHKLKELVAEVNRWRDNWFSTKPSKREISTLFKHFFSELEGVLSQEIGKGGFYLPYDHTAISRNILIRSGSSFKMAHKGIPMLSLLPFMNRKLLNLQNRFNSFRLEGPYSTDFEGSVHEGRFLFYEQLWNKNKQFYPHFIPPTTGIRLWKPEDFQ
ncbi:MAG: hypothetical protein HEP71_22685 [Roseivirga sp.]|nr:hypothetical protein [Roseivirga sp.]